MKLYVVYFRTMQDSPEVRIVGVTTSVQKANAIFKDAKRQEQEWMSDEDPDSGNWAEACMVERRIKYTKRGTQVYVAIETEWLEVVTTEVDVCNYEWAAKAWVLRRKNCRREKDPNLAPFEGDDMHLCNEDVMSDYYYSIVEVTVE